MGDSAAPSGSDGADGVIVTAGLTKTYPGGVTAVDGLDLSVRRGEIFGLLGPNGAGKTTTIGMLTTRVVPTSGRAEVNGVDVSRAPTRAKQFIGVMQESNTLDRSLNAWENLYFHGRYYGMSAKAARGAADEMLERFWLTDRAKANVAALSRGMSQRLMLARAILHRPAVVFLDEPTAGLDPQSRLALWQLMIELHAHGQTILLTTHYMEEAERLCDRVAIMDHGRILALDTPARLKRSVGPGSEVTVRAEGDLELLAARLRRIRGVSESKVLDSSVRVSLVSTDVALSKVLAAAERGGFRPTDVSVGQHTLETVFIRLTGKELRE